MWNAAGDSKYVYELIVYTSPIIESKIQNQTTINVTESANVSIECPANGVPTPKVCIELSYIHHAQLFVSKSLYLPIMAQIQWFHQAKLLSENAILSIKNVDASYQGELICIASNEYETASVSFNLNVFSKSFIARFFIYHC